MNGLTRFLIIANETKDEGLKWSGKVLSSLQEAGAIASLVIGVDDIKIKEALPSVEAVIVMGGDGTMLRVSHTLAGTGIPVIGVNLGVVGFMTEVIVSEIDSMIRRLMSGDYVLEDRMMLSGTIFTKELENADIDTTYDALNDIVLARENSLRLIAVRINVNDKYFDTTEADGIIISTPTGSTSYNLSAGGPIVQPDARLMVMTPISPYSLSSRSVVFGAGDKITLELFERRKDSENIGLASFDGANSFHMEVGDRVEITASDKCFTMIRLEEASVYEILKKKIGG